MKTTKLFYHLLVLFAGLTNVGFAQNWVQISSPTLQNLSSVFFFNKDTGFVGGGNSTSGLLFKTFDGGSSWSSMTVPTSYSINKLLFVSYDTGYFFTGNTQLYKTVNAGNSWSYIRNFGNYGAGSSSNLGQIFFQNSSVGYIRGVDYIWRTLNGGSSWDSINITSTGTPALTWFEIDFINSSVGYTSNMVGSIWKTTNSGTTWALLTAPGTMTNQIFDFKFISSNIGFYIFGFTNPVLYKTVDGGISWSVKPLPGSLIMTTQPKITNTSSTKIFVLSRSIFVSNDTGNTWSQMPISPATTSLCDWFMVNDSIGYSVGSGGIMYKTFPGSVVQPTSAATTFFTGNITSNSMTLNWTNGNGSSRIVLACANSNTLIAPSSGISYSASSTFGSGAQIGTGNYVVYNGSGNTVTVNGLNYNTAYYFRVYEYNGTGISSNYLTSSYATGGAMTLMPVKLISFTAKQKNNELNLYWQTATELNNDRFDVLRSINGDQFDEIGSVKACLSDRQGIGSHSLQNYKFTDHCSLMGLDGNSAVYYKLKQIDIDGKYEYSKVVTVQLAHQNIADFAIIPNPSNGKFNITIIKNKDQAIIDIFNLMGHKLFHAQGVSEQMQVDLSGCGRGIYFIKFSSGDSTSIRKIVIE